MRACSNRQRYLKFLIEQQEQACNEATVAARVAGSLMAAAQLQEHLASLSNPQLADVLLEFVWSNLDALSPQCTITAEAVYRLSNKSNSRRLKVLALKQQ